MRLLETLLVPVDFSGATADVMRAAAAISRPFHSEIVLMHVLPRCEECGEGCHRLLEMARAGAQSRLDEGRRELEAQGTKVRAVLLDEGEPVDAIITAAAEWEANAIVLGAAGQADASPQGLGTTASGVRRLSPKPVWLVKLGSRQPPQSLLCPVDFTGASERALWNAVHLARQFAARLSVVTVIPPLFGWATLGLTASEAAERDYVDVQGRRFAEFLQRFDFHGVSWESAVRRGDPAEQILDSAKELVADLVVMGSGGLSGLWKLLAGSVTEKVTSRVPCSMITMTGEDAIRLRMDQELTDLQAHYGRGRELLDKGFPEEARRQFQHCLNTNDLFVPAWEALAEAYQRLGQEERAQEARQTALKMRQALEWRLIEADARRQHPLWSAKPIDR